ncbi:MAG: carboxypeptidase-like regulatory domain-containing protein [Bacteroidetes bacterium]|nr:carboxypeptidase-like regulatory domain-containing protein [Bacteroidota bacterium]
MKLSTHCIFLLMSLLIPGWMMAQEEKDHDLVQFSGVVLTSDSLNAIPFANILVLHSPYGTTSDFNGYFSFVARKTDTIRFTHVGFKPAVFVIPDTITRNRYSLIQLMTADTVMLDETVIFPWPTLEEFKQAFLQIKVPDDDLERARKNLDRQKLNIMVNNLPMDGRMNYTGYMDAQTSKLYYFGQTVPVSILNPFAWAKFIQAWKDGKFKKKN